MNSIDIQFDFEENATPFLINETDYDEGVLFPLWLQGEWQFLLNKSVIFLNIKILMSEWDDIDRGFSKFIFYIKPKTKIFKQLIKFWVVNNWVSMLFLRFNIVTKLSSVGKHWFKFVILSKRI